MEREIPSSFERATAPGPIDVETGTFPMVLATEGEASDGHILSIRGAEIPERLPLQISHVNDPSFTAGSITGAKKALGEKPAALRATGQIELEGEGPAAEMRRDLALMISRSHVRAVSIRWEPTEPPMSRTDLPDDHPAHVAKDEPDYRKRWGLYFKKWRALEGSVVAVGADAAALIGRALTCAEGQRAVWARLADECVREEPGGLAALLDQLRPLFERDALLTSLQGRIAALDAIEGRIAALESRHVETPAPARPAEAQPSTPLRVDHNLTELVADLLANHRTRVAAEMREIVSAATGRIL